MANYFGDGHHDKNDIKVYGVLACRGSEKIRRDAEQCIIFRLGTLQSAGMNISSICLIHGNTYTLLLYPT